MSNTQHGESKMPKKYQYEVSEAIIGGWYQHSRHIKRESAERGLKKLIRKGVRRELLYIFAL